MSTAKEKSEYLLELRRNLPKNFCPVPFSNLILNADGSVCVCRYKTKEHAIGNIHESSLKDLWNNDKIQSWRREFLSGNITTCEVEIKERKCHLQPTNNELIPHIKFSEIQDYPMVQITANFNGLCNLECPMCDIWKLPNGAYGDLEYVRDVFPKLKKIDFYSGEPFIQKDTFKLINEISQINRECLWKFTTNCQWKLSDKLKEELSKIKVESITMSIDSLDPKTYRIIRQKGELNNALQTVDDISNFFKNEYKLNKDVNLIFNMTVQRLNWSEIPEFIRYAKKKNLYPGIWPLKGPSNLSIYTLEQHEKITILKTLFSKLTPEEFGLTTEVTVALIDSLEGTKTKKEWFCDYIDRLNNSR